jgi:hypothetical protein
LLDLLSVEICEWDGSECVLPLIRELTAELRPPEQLKVSGDGIYGTIWNTRRDDLDPERTYRIRVLASGGELGHVDVDVLDPDADDRKEGDTDHVHLVPGQTLPIRFVVEVGTGERAGSGGGTVELAGGDVVLDVPAGALTQDALLTAAPTNNVPSGGPPIVPGTAWAFGPEGIEFEHPVFMTIAYDPGNVPADVDENELRIHKLVDGEFIQQNAGLVDLVNHTVSAEVDGFSVFVVIPRDPENPEDVLPPEVRSLQVLDPTTGTYGNAVTIDVSAADGRLDFRLHMVDDGTGVDWFYVQVLSPSGQQLRYPCYTSQDPNPGGQDTNGFWDCGEGFPQYAEAGLWTVRGVYVEDNIHNAIWHWDQQRGLCDNVHDRCIPNVPQITVNSSPEDITPPIVQSFEVSPDATPRVFGPSVSVAASTQWQRVVFGLQATDDLAGVGGVFRWDRIEFRVIGPSGQDRWTSDCTLTQGTELSGFWECYLWLPPQSEAGTWVVDWMQVTDRVGNGGSSGRSRFRPDGNGQLCNQEGTCFTPPSVQVLGTGDGEPPSLASVGIALDGSDVVTTTLVLDGLSGVSGVYIRYNSVETTQWQDCSATMTAGTPNAGSWACTISFPVTAARGQWALALWVYDIADNWRYYSRRPSDGFLCYWDPTTSQQICEDFGDTDLILQ